MTSSLPITRPTKNRSGFDSQKPNLWLRLTAFLSLRSPNTQDTYIGIMREWCHFLGGEFGSVDASNRIIKATDLHAIAYKNWLEKQPGEKPRLAKKLSDKKEVAMPRPVRRKKEGLEDTLSNATIAKKFAALRRMYRLFISSNLGILENPFDSDKVPPPPKDAGRKRPTEMLNFNTVKDVIQSVDSSSIKGLRDKAILTVLFGGGLRRSEVVNIRIGDVKKTRAGTLYLYLRSTKAKRDASQALPSWAASVVEKLHETRIAQGASSADYLFISYTGPGGKVPTTRPVSASGVYKLFLNCCERSGLGKHLSPHSARATAITRLLDEGIPHREVQEFSRHSSIQMVELYDKRRISVDDNPAKILKYD